MRQIVLDTETTGLSPKEGHRMIEVGCLELVNRQLTGRKLHLYINPERAIDAGAAAVHGITEEFLQDKPIFSEIADELIEFIKDSELVIHNAPFDVGFLDHEFQGLKRNFKRIKDYCGIADTLVLARKKHPGQQVSLDALCRRYHIDNSNRDLHGALLDAELLAHVYLRMTGGQVQFSFESSNQVTSENVSDAYQEVHKKRPLKVILANEKEMKAHKDLLKQINNDAGACVWE